MLYALEVLEKYMYTKTDFNKEDLSTIMWLNKLISSKLISNIVK